MAMRRCVLRLDFQYLGKTKFGSEVLAKTKAEMKSIDTNPNPVLRYLSRKRNIDQLQIEVEGRIADDLHPAFRHTMRLCTGMLMSPILVWLLSGSAQPTYYLMVSFGNMDTEKYEKLWKLANPWVVAAGQMLMFAVIYDLSIYVRMPFFAKVLAPLFRKYGPAKPEAKGTVTIDALKRRSSGTLNSLGRKPSTTSSPVFTSSPKPLGRPLSDKTPPSRS